MIPDGAIAYWPAGDDLCLFWGETPASDAKSEQREALGVTSGDGRNREPDGEPRAATPVTVVSRVDDSSPLAGLDGGARVRLERAE